MAAHGCARCWHEAYTKTSCLIASALCPAYVAATWRLTSLRRRDEAEAKPSETQRMERAQRAWQPPIIFRALRQESA